MAGHTHTHEDLYIMITIFDSCNLHKVMIMLQKHVELCLYDVFGSQFDPDVSLALCLMPGVICLRRLTHVHSSQSRFGSRQTAQPDTSDEIQPAPAAQSIENALFRSTNSTPTDAHTMPTSALQLCLKELLCKTWAQDFSSFFTRDCSAAAHPVSM